jgi:hypothetical protein
MADILLIATIIVFFLAAGLLVRALSWVVADAAADLDSADDFADDAARGSARAGSEQAASGPGLERGRPR